MIPRDSPLWPYINQVLPSNHPAIGGVATYDPQVAVDAHALWIVEQPALMAALGELRGRDLVCWCPLDRPCHVGTLLRLANGNSDG